MKMLCGDVLLSRRIYTFEAIYVRTRKVIPLYFFFSNGDLEWGVNSLYIEAMCRSL